MPRPLVSPPSTPHSDLAGQNGKNSALMCVCVCPCACEYEMQVFHLLLAVWFAFFSFFFFFFVSWHGPFQGSSVCRAKEPKVSQLDVLKKSCVLSFDVPGKKNECFCSQLLIAFCERVVGWKGGKSLKILHSSATGSSSLMIKYLWICIWTAFKR